MAAVQMRRFTADEYHRMGELGILSPTERTELIDGEIIVMAAKGTAHAAAVLLTQDLFKERLGRQVFVKSQDPVRLGPRSEPEPDVVITVRDPLAFSTHHPQAEEVLLLIEVADSSLQYDLVTKALMYAAAKIVEYWVLDVIERELHVFRQPLGDQYQSHAILAETLTVTPLAFNDLTLQIWEMLPSKVVD